MKVFLSIVLTPYLIAVLFRFNTQPFPEGICRIFDCSSFALTPFNYFISAALIFLSVMNILEKKIIFILSAYCFLCIAILSLERSNGVYHREEVWSMILLIQLLVYVIASFKKKSVEEKFSFIRDKGMQYSRQMIAAAYVISGITKLQTAGLNWIIDSPNFAIQVVKSYSSKYYDTGNVYFLQKGEIVSQLILNHPHLIQLLFAGALMLELFAFVAVLNRKSAFWYGLLLLAMQIGIFYFLSFSILSFLSCVLIFLINLPHWLDRLIARAMKEPTIAIS